MLHTADDRRLTFINSICTQQLGLSFHVVKRGNIYEDVMALLSNDNVLAELPLRIKFAGEIAMDTGGVCRDMFSAFWEEAYKHFFDGSSLLTPVLHPHVDMSALPLVGAVLSHGYLICGFLPTRITFTSLACILLGPTTEVPSAIQVETFADSLCSFEACIVKEALASTSIAFSGELTTNLISILSRYGCRVCPTPQNIQSQLSCIAKYEFQVKPMAAFSAMSTGIPSREKPFWQSYSVKELYALYLALTATPAKVLAILEEPHEANSCQARVFIYLQQFVGNMNNHEVRRFLRFTTGSSVLSLSHISITFNNLSGLARRPIAHTCGCVLELPSMYASYLDFEQEFNAILADNEYSWQMHAV